MPKLTHTQLMRRFVKADPTLSRDAREVYRELKLDADQILMIVHIFDLDNAYADPHDPDVTKDMAEAWCVLLGAMRRRNANDAAMIRDTLADVKLALEYKRGE